MKSIHTAIDERVDSAVFYCYDADGDFLRSKGSMVGRHTRDHIRHNGT